MRKGLESETKLELTEGEFQVLLAAGTVVSRVEQVNIYFDSEWRLAERAATLRIRLAHGTEPCLTLKLPVRRHGDVRVCREFELALGFRDARRRASTLHVGHDLPGDIGDELAALGIETLHRVGWVRNTRVVLRLGPSGVVELDHLRLPNRVVVWEAEIEEPDARVRRQLVGLVRALAPASKPSLVSKFERFRRACIACVRTTQY
jgi:uncharacterized protein YjbK